MVQIHSPRPFFFFDFNRVAASSYFVLDVEFLARAQFCDHPIFPLP